MPHIPNRKEKTLRYPGHVEIIRALKQSGFFSPEKININGVSVSPLAVTSRVLFDDWKLGETEEEVTVMRITLKGFDADGKKVAVEYNLYDEYNPVTETSSMARTTGYTATATANMFLEGHFSEKGIFPPELIGKDAACFYYILQYLKDRGVVYSRTEFRK